MFPIGKFCFGKLSHEKLYAYLGNVLPLEYLEKSNLKNCITWKFTTWVNYRLSKLSLAPWKASLIKTAFLKVLITLMMITLNYTFVSISCRLILPPEIREKKQTRQITLNKNKFQ